MSNVTTTPDRKQEVKVQTHTSRNHIARSFGAGINQPQVIPNKKRVRRVNFKAREFEYDAD